MAVALHELARAITSLRRLAPEDGQLRVLLVQVDPAVRADLCRELLAAQHHVTEAASFADALVHLASDAVDVVITDDRLDAAGSGRMLLAEVRNRWPFVRRVLCIAQRAELTDPVQPAFAPLPPRSSARAGPGRCPLTRSVPEVDGSGAP